MYRFSVAQAASLCQHGPYVLVGEAVIWTDFVTNSGNESIENVNVGDIDQNNLLDPGETWEFTASGIAVARQYENLGTATGNGVVSGTSVDHDDLDHYFGYEAGIDIEKATNNRPHGHQSKHLDCRRPTGVGRRVPQCPRRLGG
jgi:hypothetical protein